METALVSGAVTFLDVLGWKGIWEKRDNAADRLRELVHELGEMVQTYRGTDIRTTVLSISDTIAMFTEAPPEQALAIHGELCSNAVCSSIQKQIPVRGATTYGRYMVLENIMVGPAVDEAASWHEMADWIGVIMTPSAVLAANGKVVPGWFASGSFSPPMKGGERCITTCLDWGSHWMEGGAYKERETALLAIFRDMGPFLPGIAGKYINTLRFFQLTQTPEEENG